MDKFETFVGDYNFDPVVGNAITAEYSEILSTFFT